MNIEEFAREMNVSVYYVNHHWKDICKAASKRGKKLVKIGKGLKAEYGVIEGDAVSACFERRKIK